LKKTLQATLIARAHTTQDDLVKARHAFLFAVAFGDGSFWCHLVMGVVAGNGVCRLGDGGAQRRLTSLSIKSGVRRWVCGQRLRVRLPRAGAGARREYGTTNPRAIELPDLHEVHLADGHASTVREDVVVIVTASGATIPTLARMSRTSPMHVSLCFFNFSKWPANRRTFHALLSPFSIWAENVPLVTWKHQNRTQSEIFFRKF
jgi:hypothetical protein